MSRVIALLSALAAAVVAVFSRRRISTVEVKPNQFGDPSRAEFYAIQTNPQTSNGKHILRANLAEEVYLVPAPLLIKMDIANADVKDSSPGSILKKVEMILSQAGRSKVQSFVALTSADNPVALVWQNEAQYLYPAKKLDDSGPITLADGVDSNRAKALKMALV
jgi:hypothetical protein